MNEWINKWINEWGSKWMNELSIYLSISPHMTFYYCVYISVSTNYIVILTSEVFHYKHYNHTW